LNDRGSILTYAFDVTFFQERVIGFRIGTIQPGCADLLHIVHTPTEKARPSGLYIVDASADLIDTSKPVGIDSHTQVDIGKQVERA
jgi:hypothetical protein